MKSKQLKELGFHAEFCDDGSKYYTLDFDYRYAISLITDDSLKGDDFKVSIFDGDNRTFASLKDLKEFIEIVKRMKI